MSRRTTIFLDFDGVLHPSEYLSFKVVDGELVFGQDLRFCWAGCLWDLIRENGSQLVIHSSWRHTYSLEQLRQMLPVKLGERVVAVTVGDDRYTSILAYVDAESIIDYVILDDAANDFPMGCNELLLCQERVGISCPEIQKKLADFLDKQSDLVRLPKLSL